MFTYVVHINVDALRATYGNIQESSAKKVLAHIESGRLISLERWIAALETLLKRPIDDVLGKPSRRCAEVALSALGCRPAEVLMVGDRMETDIRMATETGMRSGLVLSGVSAASDVEKYAFAPDYIWRSVADLPASLGLT